ncbi:MAG: hypothetical protein ACFFA6_15105, partial [Promethearchaeota archaeon]
TMNIRNSKKNKKIGINTLFLSILFLILFCNIKFSFGVNSNNSLMIPLNFQIFEFSEQKDKINNISSLDIELPSSTWNITHIELNFTNIEYYKREIKAIEDIPIMDDLFLDKHNTEGLGTQIKVNDTITIFGVYLNIKTFQTHALDEIYVQIRGYNSSTNAPNSTIYGYVDLNCTIVDGWNYQNFTSPIRLSKGNYFLVMEGFVHATGEYHWYYNDFNPNNPDLYRSENYGTGWVNGIQGSPFLYKLVQEIKKKDIYPEEFNMTAEINGNYHKILNSIYIGSGHLTLSGIDFSPNDEILHIPITPNRFLFNLSSDLKLKNQYLSNAFVNITEKEDNFWKILPDINRCNYNYSIKIELPNNWYNLIVYKDNIDITASENIVINGNLLYILNDTINDDNNWEITAKSPKIDFILDLSRGTEFQLGQELIFSAIAPIREGNFTFKLYNEHGAELDYRIIPVTSDETLYSFNITSTASLGNWTAYIYWNNYNDASVKSQVFTIVPSSSSSQPSPHLSDINLILILSVIIGGILIGGSLAVYQISKRNKRRIETKLKRLSNKFKDILSLNYLMVSDIKSGVNVYEQTFAGKSMDPSLISGFLDAIRNFGVELVGSYRKSETLTLDYQDSIILMNESKDFRLIIIMSDKPSEEFTNLITNLAKDIEEKYGDLLREFKGGQVTQFAGIRELIEMHLNVSFASPLTIVLSKKVKLNTLEKSVVEKAKEIMEQTNLNYFYTTFLMPNQKFDPEITKVIFNLISRKIFQPISLNLKE